MATTINACARMLSRERLPHHLDAEERCIRLVLVTGRYRNRRGEQMAIVQVAMPDEGRRCRVTIERAFAAEPDAAATCLSLCRAAAATPLVGVEFDEDCENLRIVAEMAVEDGKLTPRQLVSMIEATVAAAETWQAAVTVSAIDHTETKTA